MARLIGFEDIQKANATIQTTNIKGKEYAEVNQRIKAFRMVYPNGYISTKMLSNENGVCVFQAEVGDGEHLLGTGTAYEKESSSYINKTSYIENCETSAVGRALGMAGFGIDTSVASYEEVANAIKQQETVPETIPENVPGVGISNEDWEVLIDLCKQTNTPSSELVKKVGRFKQQTMTTEQYSKAIVYLNKKADEK